LIIGIRELKTKSKMPRTLSKSGFVRYLELLDLLLLLGLPLPDDAEHLADHRLDPLGERLREGLPEEEGVEDSLALVVVACVTPPDGRVRLSPSKSVLLHLRSAKGNLARGVFRRRRRRYSGLRI
jgi:hypothetical protein